MDEIPVHGLDELEVHLQKLLEAPEIQLNEKLIDEVDLQLTGQSSALFYCLKECCNKSVRSLTPTLQCS